MPHAPKGSRTSLAGRTSTPIRLASAVSAILVSAGGPYVIKRERETNGGLYGAALRHRAQDRARRADRVKYVKAGDPAPTPEALAKIKSEAIDQLDQYSRGRDIATEWRLAGATGVPPVALHRLVLVFHGGECVLSEEV